MRKNNKSNANTILHGIILPVKWDKNGRAIRISLNTADEKVYMIDFSGPGKELLQYLREMIKIEGMILQKLDGSLNIKVKHYSVLGEI